MQRAIHNAARVRTSTSPNPWVGCVVQTVDGRCFDGATEPPGGRHAEIVALHAAMAAGADLAGATVWTTLEPCNHHGRTPPCTEALAGAGVAHVVVAVTDPDPLVSGSGVGRLRDEGIEVTIGVEAELVAEQLRPYLHHRRTRRPFVVLKLAHTLDGRVAATDGTSQWITGAAARTAAHRLRAESDAIVVGAGTVRVDDPSLTTRLVDGPSPRRVVLGHAHPDAKVHPCLEWTGPLDELLEHLGADGVLQLMVEGGPTTAAGFHDAGLVDRYVFHIAPALMGAGAAMLPSDRVGTIGELWRGRFISATPIGDDLEVVIDPIRTDTR